MAAILSWPICVEVSFLKISTLSTHLDHKSALRQVIALPELTHKNREMHWYMFSTAATDLYTQCWLNIICIELIH